MWLVIIKSIPCLQGDLAKSFQMVTFVTNEGLLQKSHELTPQLTRPFLFYSLAVGPFLVCWVILGKSFYLCVLILLPITVSSGFGKQD